MSDESRANFGSKIGAILAAAGSAVGLGHIWRFPYQPGNDGGAAFILIYIGCILFFGIPVMIAEFTIGRHSRSNTARAYQILAPGTQWKWVGRWGVLTGFLILSYYAVVAGWTLEYFLQAASNSFIGKTPEQFTESFNSFTASPWRSVLWLVLFMFATHYIIVKGVQQGIERSAKILMPVLFVLLIIMASCSVLLPGSGPGLEFLLMPDFNKVNPGVLLSAMGQTFYSLSLGMGCLCTYASYFQSDTNLTKTAINVATIDTLVAILAGLIIFPAAFSVGIQPDAGPSLVFITLPNATISMHEVVTVYLHEEFKMSRRKAAWLVTLVCGFIGIICALSLGIGKEYTLFGMTLFDIFDFVTAKLMLPIGGFFISIFTGWYLDKKILHDELNSGGHLPIYLYKAIVFILRFIAPIGIGFVFINELGVL